MTTEEQPEYEVYKYVIYQRDEHGELVLHKVPDSQGEMKLVIKHFPGEHVLYNGEPIIKGDVSWKRYKTDVFDIELNVHLHQGDLVLSKFGNPIPTSLTSAVPRVVFNGIRDGQSYLCRRMHVDALRYFTDVELADTIDAINDEVRARVGGKVEYCAGCDTRRVYQNGGTTACLCKEVDEVV